MARFPNQFGGGNQYPLGYEARESNPAIARFFNAVYAWMAAGLALTAVVAWWISTQPQLFRTIMSGPMLIGLVIAELALVWTISAATQRLSAAPRRPCFWCMPH